MIMINVIAHMAHMSNRWVRESFRLAGFVELFDMPTRFSPALGLLWASVSYDLARMCVCVYVRTQTSFRRVGTLSVYVY